MTRPKRPTISPPHLCWGNDGRLSLKIGPHQLDNILFGITLPGTEAVRLIDAEVSSQGSATREHSTVFPLTACAGRRELHGEVTLSRCGSGVIWQSRLWPKDGQAWSVQETEEFSGEVTLTSPATKWKVFHADNIRGISAGKTLLEGTYWLEVAALANPLKNGRWQSFPGLWVRDPDTGAGFVLGELSQTTWKHTVDLIPCDQTLRIKGRFHPPGLTARPFAAGEIYEGEALYFELVQTDSPEVAFAGYLQALEHRLQPSRQSSLLRNSAFWDSWNDRQPHFWDVSEDLLQRTTRILTERFPTVRSLEIDDGYAHAGFHEVEADRWGKLEHGLDPDARIEKVRRVRRLGVAFLYEPDEALARDRFPRGLRAAREDIAKAGFLPAIWLGLNVVFDAALVRDHPDWFIPCQALPGADPELNTVFGPAARQGFRVLDPSLPEVREYLTRIADRLFVEWGFEGFKLDFWSYAFENDGFRLQRAGKSAYEWRSWLFQMFRDRLAPESYFTIGCDISTGNPFVCPWVDNVRYGIDIGNGRWENIKYTALTGTFLLHIQACRFFILNCDSIGLLTKLKENERHVLWAWAVATRSLCELAGDLAVQKREHLRPLQKLLLSPKNGSPAFVGGTEHLDHNEPAQIVWTKGDNFSTGEISSHLPDRILAVFNWTDVPADVVMDASRLGAAKEATLFDANLLSPEVVLRKSARWTVSLPPRSVRLSHLSFLNENVPRILASAWRVNTVSFQDGTLHLILHGDAPEGLLIFWPFDHEPRLDSSLPVRLSREENQVFHLEPILAGDTLGYWHLQLKNAENPSN